MLFLAKKDLIPVLEQFSYSFSILNFITNSIKCKTIKSQAPKNKDQSWILSDEIRSNLLINFGKNKDHNIGHFLGGPYITRMSVCH